MADWDASVAVAYVHPTTVEMSFMHSLLNVIEYEAVTNRRMLVRIEARCATGGIVDARNKAVAQFLNTTCEWLWWVDTDMGFAPDSLSLLLGAADQTDRPFVSGLCFAQMETAPDGMGGYHVTVFPAVFQWHEASDPTQSGLVAWRDYPRDSVAPIAATGSAFVLIHRTVFEKVADKFGDGSWYDPVMNPASRQLLGEDLSFCARVRMAGMPIYLHSGVRTTHAKPHWVGEDLYQHPDLLVTEKERELIDGRA